MTTLTRHYLKPNGKTARVRVALCTCGLSATRGPMGGICPTCHGAVSSVDEQRALNSAIWKEFDKTHPNWVRELNLHPQSE